MPRNDFKLLASVLTSNTPQEWKPKHAGKGGKGVSRPPFLCFFPCHHEALPAPIQGCTAWRTAAAYAIPRTSERARLVTNHELQQQLVGFGNPSIMGEFGCRQRGTGQRQPSSSVRGEWQGALNHSPQDGGEEIVLPSEAPEILSFTVSPIMCKLKKQKNKITGEAHKKPSLFSFPFPLPSHFCSPPSKKSPKRHQTQTKIFPDNS